MKFPGGLVSLLLVVLIFSFATAEQQPKKRTPPPAKSATTQPMAPPEAIPPNAAFEVLDERNRSGKLSEELFSPIARMMGMGRIGGLSPENCFGWRFAAEARLIGESSGGYYGVSSKDHSGKEFEGIGILLVEAEFKLEGELLRPATYLVVAALDSVELATGSDISKNVTLPLKNPLDAGQFVNSRGGSSPRYGLVLQGSELFLTVGQNRLRIQPAPKS